MQVTKRAHRVVDISRRVGMLGKTLYLWARPAKEQTGVGSEENATLGK